MRGAFADQGALFSYIIPEARIPSNHPLRKIRELVRDVLGELNRTLGKLYANEGRPSTAPEQLLSALLLQVLYGIRFGDGGEHDVSNGLLLRIDIHRLFDLGYVTVSNEGWFEVGRRLKDDFENGRHYYALQGQPLLMPSNLGHWPGRDLLEWHQTNRFLG
jgi:hypothetical protein